MRQHESGQCTSTKGKRPLELIYSEVCRTRVEARIREKYFKSGIGRDKIKEINQARVAELADAQS